METNYELLYYSLKKLHESANKSIEDLLRQNKELEIDNTVLKAKLINAQKNVDINKDIMQSCLLDHNKMKDSFISEINELRKKINCNFSELNR